MIKSIRNSKGTKFIASYLAIMIFVEMTQPMRMYALTEGPSQPEFNSFTPIGTSDMVDLASGDFNYNIPIMDVGGYPINLAYSSGVTMDQEASWVGLGWNLNIGQINRNVRGLPDDFNGDDIQTTNNLRDNVTVGVQGYINPQIIGVLDNSATVSAGLNLEYNNYRGISAVPSFGLSFKLSENVSVGMQLSSSNEEGASITPSVSLSNRYDEENKTYNNFSASISPSLTYNSRQGLSSINLSSSINKNIQKENGKNYSANIKGGSGSVSFINNTFTPTKRVGLKNNNITFAFSGGPDLFGGHFEASITASASKQSLIEKVKNTKAYGYENTENATESDLLDFNREKEVTTVSSNTLVMPVTNYTYDILSVQGQGVGGTLRPYRGQIGYVFDSKVSDISGSASLGFEIEGGAGFHGGGNIKYSESNSYTGNWNTVVTPFLNEKTSGNNLDYEKVYYKNVGENRIDREYSTLFSNNLGGNSPITFLLDGNKEATNKYLKKTQTSSTANLSIVSTINSPLKRQNRENRNQGVQKLTKNEIEKYNLNQFITPNSNAKGHHTAGYIITDENGSRNVFGQTAYNKEKHEVTFSTNRTGNPSTGMVTYGYGENSPSNSSGIDHYYNDVKTPEYAHTYLLTSILSPDYQDLTNNGVSDDDLGTYTKFEYTTTSSNYNWRVPLAAGTASYNEGLKTDKKDQKASYLSGNKELKYVTKIITKTHVAFIDLANREDGLGAASQLDGGKSSSSRTKYITSIRLYSKPEITAPNGSIFDPTSTGLIKPIKTAHFEYDYSLCKGIENSFDNSGKLTLKKVYFTYRGSNMGRYTPYKFNYSPNTSSQDTSYDPLSDPYNPQYNPKNYDVWGNYKENMINTNGTSPQDFPYVEQDDKETQDIRAAAWTLSSIELPSGGKIKLSFESDDYQYVQNKKTMQMFKVEGVTSGKDSPISQSLYTSSSEAKYIVIKVNAEDNNLPNETIIKRYTEGLKGKSIYFNFYLNMIDSDYDFVSGYFIMDKDPEIVLIGENKKLLIPMKLINREGKFNSNNLTNPISVAAWFFGRQHVPSQIYGNHFDPSLTNVVDIGRSVLKNLTELAYIFSGPNKHLKDMGCAKNFIPERSWIRLLEPSGSKLGGGARVKKVEMLDGWDEMLDISNSNPDIDIDRYKKTYGQEYDYTLTDGSSSGVATYEPNVCKENPLIQPFYHNPEKMAAKAYQETPFGESFFPSPTVTYRKVSVKTITAADDDGQNEQRKTRSGKVITEFYTSYDFPTKTDFTPIDNGLTKRFQSNEDQAIGNMLKGLLGLKIDVTTSLNVSQGFVIETNDMNGKMKKQEVQNNAGDKISSVEYIYSTEQNDPKRLKSELPVIDKDGLVTQNHALGLHYDVTNDFRQSYSEMNVYGLGVNVDVIPLVFIPIVIGMGLPDRSSHKQILKTVVTTKVIQKTGILIEKIAEDLGSAVSTKNLAWDANTGQVLLTQTVNEYDDSYYSFNYPAYWNYERMGMASENADITGVLKFHSSITEGGSFVRIDNITNIYKYLKLGDELACRIKLHNSLSNNTYYAIKKLWVAGYNSDKSAIKLINNLGEPITINSNKNIEFKIIRSGNRNNQMASMASITLQKNPLVIDPNSGEGYLNENLLNFNTTITDNTLYTPTVENPKVINASAIEYSEDWKSQCENGLPESYNNNINKYLYNVLGQWRPVKSYAYLTGRNTTTNTNTRTSGYLVKFNPFYKRKTTGGWEINATNWTSASQVTMYNPYGVELENKDALNRYSAAQYGYKYKLPVAVGSNAKYQEIGFDGFEDYISDMIPSVLRPHFGYADYVNQDNHVTTKQSHTGKKSIVIKSGSRIEMNRKVNPCPLNEQGN